MSMYADEESDEGVVPMKQPNKEGSPSAEAVEGRTLPEGNGGETTAARTLRREPASNGLVAVRRAARQSKSVRFTALLHHIKLKAIKVELRRCMRDPIAKTGSWVQQMLQGHLNYYAVSGNHPSMWWFCNQVRWLWIKSLRRRSQKAHLSWERFVRIVNRFFPPIKVLHPLPLHRFDARTQGRSPVR
jgi:hypothetical protein